MTHSGGKLHEVGDRGQRYVVSAFDVAQDKRRDLGYTNSHEDACHMAAGAMLSPNWTQAWVTDRDPQKALKG